MVCNDSENKWALWDCSRNVGDVSNILKTQLLEHAS